MNQRTLSSFFDGLAQSAKKTENKSIGQINDEIKVWITHIRDLQMSNICKTRVWYKSRFIREAVIHDWSEWTINHNNRLQDIVENLPKYVPTALMKFLSEEDFVVVKNYPIKAKVTKILLLTGKLDAMLITLQNEMIAVLEVKGSNHITASHILQTKLYMIGLHLMYPASQIYGLISNGMNTKLISWVDLNFDLELGRIIKRTSFLMNPDPPKPEYVFISAKEICCENCGYYHCPYRTTANELIAKI